MTRDGKLSEQEQKDIRKMDATLFIFECLIWTGMAIGVFLILSPFLV